ncbi:MAG: hypothetical protein CMO01_25040 [Thalassobius sp.]|nr:hypothetical protein [Thalassovita sp.]
MKAILLVLLISIPHIGFSQNSDLFQHVDSLIQNELEYVNDSTSDKLPNLEWDTTKVTLPHFSTFSSNPSPLIILDGKIIDKSELNKYVLAQISEIDVYEKNDSNMHALFGTSSKNGVVLIQTVKFSKQIKHR